MPEPKRRGRPAKTETESPEQVVMAKTAVVESSPLRDTRDAWTVKDHEPAGPACPRCNKSTERNTQVFKSLGLNAVRCMTCKMAAVEGDSDQFYFDLKSAAAGLLLKRALVVFELKHPTYPVPAIKTDSFFEIIASDAGDPRWNE